MSRQAFGLGVQSMSASASERTADFLKHAISHVNGGRSAARKAERALPLSSRGRLRRITIACIQSVVTARQNRGGTMRGRRRLINTRPGKPLSWPHAVAPGRPIPPTPQSRATGLLLEVRLLMEVRGRCVVTGPALFRARQISPFLPPPVGNQTVDYPFLKREMQERKTSL